MGRCIILFQGADLLEQKDRGPRDSEQKVKGPRKSDPRGQRRRDSGPKGGLPQETKATVPQPHVNELVSNSFSLGEKISSSVKLARVDGKGYSAGSLHEDPERSGTIADGAGSGVYYLRF